MSKQNKKTIKKATGSVAPGTLPKGEAFIMKRAFDKRLGNSGATNLPQFPDAVCFTIADLRKYLDSAEKTINAGGPVPANETGIAIMPAVRNNKVTFMLVATRFTEDRNIQQVLSINNPVTGIFGSPGVSGNQKMMKKSMMADPPPDPPVGDDALDNGSMWP